MPNASYEPLKDKWKLQRLLRIWFIFGSVNRFSSKRAGAGELPLPSGSVRCETFSAQFNSLLTEGIKQQAHYSFVNISAHSFFFPPFFTHFLMQAFPDDPALLKHTDLIEKKRQYAVLCSLFLLLLFIHLFINLSETPAWPNMLELGAKYHMLSEEWLVL